MTKPTIANYDWRKSFQEKNLLAEEWGYKEIPPHDFYRELFPVGSCEKNSKAKTGKGNIIGSCIRPRSEGKSKQYVIHDNHEKLDKFIGDKFGLIYPITFFGHTHTKQNAHELFAFTIDVDYVTTDFFKNLNRQITRRIQLMPTAIVLSGRGVHIYYFLKEPIRLYHNRAEKLREIKEALIYRLWNDATSLREERDYTGIYQGFRCVGSQTKFQDGTVTKAWRFSDSRYTVDDIVEFFEEWGTTIDLTGFYEKPEPKLTLAEAKIKYPEWYERRIVRGEPKITPKKSKQGQKYWTCKIDLYEWWKRKIKNEVKSGGRYYSIAALCGYGLKCGIPEEQIINDAYSFYEYLDSISENEDDHFTIEDLEDGLKFLENKSLTRIMGRDWIKRKVKVDIPKNTRHGLPQHLHLKSARNRLEILNENAGRCLQGRPSKKDKILRWRKNNPNGTPKQCITETGISKNTVYKWWNFNDSGEN